MTNRWLSVSLLVIVVLLTVFQAAAQDEDNPTLRVAVKPLEPFVMGSGADLRGFSIDLWRELADRLDLSFEFVEVETVVEQLASVEGNSADIAITGISITEAREERVDFSYPYFNAGLQIMSRVSEGLSIEQILGNLLSPGILQIVVVFCLVILTGGHLIWLIERHSDTNFPRAYFRGVVEGMWWSSVLVITGNLTDRAPVTALSRLISLIWLLIGVLLIANFTASVTASATVNQLGSMIEGVNDLSGRSVVTVQGSTAEEYLHQLGIIPSTVERIDEAYTLLEAGDFDAIVYDAPVLRYYEARGGAGKVQVVGTIFNPEDYGIALADNSPLRESINRGILALKEDGTYQRLYQFWFGSES